MRKQYVVNNVAVMFTLAEEMRVRRKAKKLRLTVEKLIEREIDSRPRSSIDDQLDAIAAKIAKLSARSAKLRAKRDEDWDSAKVFAAIKRLVAPDKKKRSAS